MVKTLFVCTGNACRSQIAEAFAQRLGHGVLDAHSTGTAPRPAVSTRAIEAMGRRGYDLRPSLPKAVDALPPGPYEWMIRLGCGDLLLVPALHREDWDLPAMSSLPEPDFEAVCDEIEARVRDLVARARAWAETAGFPLRLVPAAATASISSSAPTAPPPPPHLASDVQDAR